MTTFRFLLPGIITLFSFFPGVSANEEVPFPEIIKRQHPRLISSSVSKTLLQQKLKNSEEVRASYEVFKSRITPYVDQFSTDPEWMRSRLQMYWKTKHTDIFIRGGVYSHAEGEAPVPTVRFPGTRHGQGKAMKPKLEDVRPYMDEKKGLYLQNKTTGSWEWMSVSETGHVLSKINHEIMGYARDAALIYWLEGDETYAEFATSLFDTYMEGLYYRNVPVDLSFGHHQTLVSYTEFQVISENIVDKLAACYDFLHGRLNDTHPERIPIYIHSFQKLADQIMKNGVPWNNWNLYQAKHVIKIALVLDDNAAYDNHKGCQYYLDAIFNRTQTRQWSLMKTIGTNYDPDTFIWAESPTYSINVARDFSNYIEIIQRSLDYDIVPYLPQIPGAIAALPQYLFPNGYHAAFGDSHYDTIPDVSMLTMVDNARLFGKPGQKKRFTAIAKLVAGEHVETYKTKSAFLSLLNGTAPSTDSCIPAADIDDVTTQTFYSPNVSWLVLRNGMDPQNGLMVSQNASLGNHMHANNISIELYGKGYIQGIDPGIGGGYDSIDYLEYYSQAPAHNTVVVDGISSYTTMRSFHGFGLRHLYPESGIKEGYFPDITFSDVSFLEPETTADQNRVVGIIRTGKETGYYVDIYRSKKRNGGDRYHDYFYHNIGQKLTLTNINGTALDMYPTEKLTFADNELFAYDYIYDKFSVKTDNTTIASFELAVNNKEKTYMNLWMTGDTDRELFKALSPHAFSLRGGMVPDKIAEAPVPVFVARNYGEAWTHPFIAVFEPHTETSPASIKNIEMFPADSTSETFVGLKVESFSGRTDHIFSSFEETVATNRNISFKGHYGVVSNAGNETTLFLGAGTMVKSGSFRLDFGRKNGNGALRINGNDYYLALGAPAHITLPDIFAEGTIVLTAGNKKIRGIRNNGNEGETVVFSLPEIAWQRVVISTE